MRDRNLVGSWQRSLSSRFILPRRERPLLAGNKEFLLAVRKKNGAEYEPSSLRAFIQSIDQHLCKNNYGFSLLNDKEFHEVHDILKKQKQLKSIGKGNRPNAADPLSDEDIDTFYNCKVLGIHSPRALLNTLWMNNCTFFGMRPGKEQRDRC